MEEQVWADIVPFIPSILKKVPWQVRAALIVAFFGFSIYAIVTQFAGTSMFPHAVVVWGVLGVLAGAPAGANVTVKPADLKGAWSAGYNDAVTALKELDASAPQAAKSVESAVQSVAPVAAEVESNVAKVAPEVLSAVEDLSKKNDPPK